MSTTGEPCWCCGAPLCVECSHVYAECGHPAAELVEKAMHIASPEEARRIRAAVLGFSGKPSDPEHGNKSGAGERERNMPSGEYLRKDAAAAAAVSDDEPSDEDASEGTSDPTRRRA